MVSNGACDRETKGVRWLIISLLCFVLLFAASAQAQLPGGLGKGLGGTTDGVGPGYGPLCAQPRLKEKFECPGVECDRNIQLKGPDLNSKKFVNRVKDYFEYKPPADNRSVYLDKNLHDYQIGKPGESAKTGAYNMDPPKKRCGAQTGNKVSEPCQDNRWRDMCLINPASKDLDYQTYQRKLMEDELPLPGIAGSLPQYDKTSSKLNCIVPKNTERLSPLELDNGWRYRDMCPGSQELRRVVRDKLENTYDIFRGEYGCFNPLPKCSLKNDWKLSSIQWKNTEYKGYLQSFTGSLGGIVGNVLGGLLGGSDLNPKLKNLLSSDQFAKIKTLLNPKKSAAAECKPAYWVRLMLDSCANQYIAQKSMNPDYIYNPDSGRIGLSPRFCQPFKTKPIPFGQEEYDVADYLERSYKGLLKEDYMPWIEYNRHATYKKSIKGVHKLQAGETEHAKKAEEFRKKNWPERKMKWPSKTWNNSSKVELKTGLGEIKNVSINKYAAHPVERIVDPLHPFSPRYDIAELTDGSLLSDRNLFGDSTESKAKINVVAKAPTPTPGGTIEGLKKYWCVPDAQKGYFESGCTIYCSAVEVDLLRFRYKDYRLCMGCQIDTNEKAFWDEYETNRKYYKNRYCDPIFKDIDCEYGDTICSGCGLRNKSAAEFAAAVKALGIAKGVCKGGVPIISQIACASIPAWKAIIKKLTTKTIPKYTVACEKCKTGANAESLSRTRSRDNKKAEPAWGPTAVGDNWPVCSTRFDHAGDEALCEEAKTQYTCDIQGDKAVDDPNIAEESKQDAAQCISKNIKDICHDAAKPVYSVNFLKTRTRKGDFRTADTTPKKKNMQTGLYIPTIGGDFDKKVANWKKSYADEDPAEGHGFREYFGSNRPYMRWWDTGKEAFQEGAKPDYWCDWGQNDAVMGVGRDYNSIHGRKAQLCRYGGGGGIGDSCFTVEDWKAGKKNGQAIPHNRRFPSLAGSEWAELKMYQANCFRSDGLNCLCQYEKIFKEKDSQDKALSMMGTEISSVNVVGIDEDTKREIFATVRDYLALSWRGYVSTPANRDDATTGPVIGKNQQFPYLYGDPKSGSIISGGLDKAKVGDIVIWPAGLGVLPHVAVVTATNNLNDYGKMSLVPNASRWVQVTESNNGKYLDACGVTGYSGRGPKRKLYPQVSELPEYIQELIKEQVAATYYCDDPELGHCVERRWNSAIIYRIQKDERGLIL